MDNRQLVESFIEVESLDRDQFLKVKETLTRVGIASRQLAENGKPTLWQSCHILHKKGHYYCVHFKQLFLLDGKVGSTVFTEEDKDRTELVAALLQEWGLVKVIGPIDKPVCAITVIPYTDKNRWNLRPKYTIGNSGGE